MSSRSRSRGPMQQPSMSPSRSRSRSRGPMQQPSMSPSYSRSESPQRQARQATPSLSRSPSPLGPAPTSPSWGPTSPKNIKLADAYRQRTPSASRSVSPEYAKGARPMNAPPKAEVLEPEVPAAPHTEADKPEDLPIAKYKDEIVTAVKENSIIVVMGETGSGKTTQVCQYLADNGMAKDGLKIAISQPRRVGAMAAAERVAEERGGTVGKEVGYTIRFEDNSCEDTRIKFLTDGCLLREVLADHVLSAYEVVILDEAHERSIHTDVLFALLKHAAKERPSLRVLITSATLDTEKFSKFFDDCPVISVPGRNFPVEIIHQPISEADAWCAGAIDKCIELHCKQPAGHILLFLTGQDEIDRAVEALHRKAEQIDSSKVKDMACPDLMVLPCYGALPHKQQGYIFDEPPEGCRKIVVATNIAETSLTVPGIRYVVDPGWVKQKMYDESVKMESLRVHPISRTAAKQRTGRAGRTMPGVCIRLYSSDWMQEEMLEETVPEIQRSSLANTVLMLKGLGITDVLGFDFMDSPGKDMLEKALLQLCYLGALQPKTGAITSMGEKMLELPVEPELSRILIEAIELSCLEPVLTIVSLLSAENVFYRPNRDDLRQEASASHQRFYDPDGDHMSLLNVYDSWIKNGKSSQWCRRNFIDSRAMNRSGKIRSQLEGLVEQRWKPARSTHNGSSKRILQAVVAGLFTNAARLVPVGGAMSACYRTVGREQEQLVHVHPSSAVLSTAATVRLESGAPQAFMRQVSAVNHTWLKEPLAAMRKVHVEELSGREVKRRREPSPEPEPELDPSKLERRNDDSGVSEARKRFLERKAAKTGKKKR